MKGSIPETDDPSLTLTKPCLMTPISPDSCLAMKRHQGICMVMKDESAMIMQLSGYGDCCWVLDLKAKCYNKTLSLPQNDLRYITEKHLRQVYRFNFGLSKTFVL